jgi:probable rRNA maturation factor
MTTENDQITVQFSCCLQDVDAEISRLKKLAIQVCRKFSSEPLDVSIAIVDDTEISKINSQFLNKKKQTDVISFDLSDHKDKLRTFEIVVNAQQAARQAKQRNHSTEAELALYITHGLLHNLGFDDADDDLAKTMHNMEDEILQKAGFGVVYNSKKPDD